MSWSDANISRAPHPGGPPSLSLLPHNNYPRSEIGRSRRTWSAVRGLPNRYPFSPRHVGDSLLILTLINHRLSSNSHDGLEAAAQRLDGTSIANLAVVAEEENRRPATLPVGRIPHRTTAPAKSNPLRGQGTEPSTTTPGPGQGRGTTTGPQLQTPQQHGLPAQARSSPVGK